MKFTMFVTSGAMQFNLEPENQHEKEFLALLDKYKGDVSIKRGVDLAMSQANFIRSYGEKSDIVAITISKPVEQNGEQL